MSRSADTQGLDALFAAAQAAQARAYAPYSRFCVGAAILTEDGAIHAGCNVENAAYPQGACAEANAIAAMALAGQRRIKAALIYGEAPQPVTPCGGCRQRLREFAAPDVMIHSAGPQGLRASFRLEDLLPHSFGPDHLPSDPIGQKPEKPKA